MIMAVRYVHTNLVARDWRALSRFYCEVFGCVEVPPVRDYAGPALEAGTGIVGARLRGVHLRLPGHGDDGPTLEVFEYDEMVEAGQPVVNRVGLGHLAFSVASVAEARDAVIAQGGGALGEVVELTTADGGTVTWCYVTDPEGNLIELQSWS